MNIGTAEIISSEQPSPKKMVVCLPVPTSVNKLYVNIKGCARKRTKTKDYKHWIGLAEVAIYKAKINKEIGKVSKYPVEIHVKVFDGVGLSHNCDLNNMWKAIDDILVSSKIIENDNLLHINKEVIEFVNKKKKEKKKLTLK